MRLRAADRARVPSRSPETGAPGKAISGPAGNALDAGLAHAVRRLLRGEALVLQLLDEARAREARHVEIARGGLGGLLVPVGADRVDAVGGIGGRVALVLEPLDEAGARERCGVEVALGARRAFSWPAVSSEASSTASSAGGRSVLDQRR